MKNWNGLFSHKWAYLEINFYGNRQIDEIKINRCSFSGNLGWVPRSLATVGEMMIWIGNSHVADSLRKLKTLNQWLRLESVVVFFSFIFIRQRNAVRVLIVFVVYADIAIIFALFSFIY